MKIWWLKLCVCALWAKHIPVNTYSVVARFTHQALSPRGMYWISRNSIIIPSFILTVSVLFSPCWCSVVYRYNIHIINVLIIKYVCSCFDVCICRVCAFRQWNTWIPVNVCLSYIILYIIHLHNVHTIVHITHIVCVHYYG